MPWKKRIQPGEKLPLKLTEAQRTLVLDALTCLDSDCEKVVRETPAGEPVMMSLDDLDIFGGCLAADANHTEDRKLQGKLDTIFKKVQRLLDTYTDQEQDEAVAIERAKARIGRAVVLALADEPRKRHRHAQDGVRPSPRLTSARGMCTRWRSSSSVVAG
jgi:hypothetical protein